MRRITHLTDTLGNSYALGEGDSDVVDIQRLPIEPPEFIVSYSTGLTSWTTTLPYHAIVSWTTRDVEENDD